MKVSVDGFGGTEVRLVLQSADEHEAIYAGPEPVVAAAVNPTHAAVKIAVDPDRALLVRGLHSGARRPMKARMTVHDAELFGTLEVRVEIDEERNLLDKIESAFGSAEDAGRAVGRFLSGLLPDEHSR